MKMNSLILLSLLSGHSYAIDIPSLHPNIVENNGNLLLINKTQQYPFKPVESPWTLTQLMGHPEGTDQGIQFHFGNLQGQLHYGLIKFTDGRYPQTIFYDTTVPIRDGEAQVPLCDKLSGVYDIVAWTTQGRGVLGYRVEQADGLLLYDGKIGFTGNCPIQVNPASIVEGPFVHFAADGQFDHSLRISFDTLQPTVATVSIRPQSNYPCRVQVVMTDTPATHHEMTLTHLSPATEYMYTVTTGQGNSSYTESYTVTTAPLPGSRQPMVFAYASDSRQGKSGGGEQQMEGINAYILKKIAALARLKNAAFLQFSGDLIRGYSNSADRTRLQFRNWKRVMEPFAHYLPILTTMGNHDSLLHIFTGRGKYGISVDAFPYATASAEALFANQFVNPTNGPISEDDSPYDPQLAVQDFPSYAENVFYYLYDNIAMVVLNTDYWYSPTLEESPFTGGNLHGYLMDQQLAWLETTLNQLEKNPALDFIFVTQHAPVLPNGNHVQDTMWYHGNNAPRAVVKFSAEGDNLIIRGIIEQRDKFLQILMQHSKVVAMLVGDEHNFNILKITKDTPLYPDGWEHEDIRNRPEFRPLYQITNGAAGAPYSGQELMPWSASVQKFSNQNALVLFYVTGQSLQMEVLNPDTLEVIWPKQAL